MTSHSPQESVFRVPDAKRHSSSSSSAPKVKHRPLLAHVNSISVGAAVAAFLPHPVAPDGSDHSHNVVDFMCNVMDYEMGIGYSQWRYFGERIMYLLGEPVVATDSSSSRRPDGLLVRLAGDAAPRLFSIESATRALLLAITPQFYSNVTLPLPASALPLSFLSALITYQNTHPLFDFFSRTIVRIDLLSENAKKYICAMARNQGLQYINACQLAYTPANTIVPVNQGKGSPLAKALLCASFTQLTAMIDTHEPSSRFSSASSSFLLRKMFPFFFHVAFGLPLFPSDSLIIAHRAPQWKNEVEHVESAYTILCKSFTSSNQELLTAVKAAALSFRSFIYKGISTDHSLLSIATNYMSTELFNTNGTEQFETDIVEKLASALTKNGKHTSAHISLRVFCEYKEVHQTIPYWELTQLLCSNLQIRELKAVEEFRRSRHCLVTTKKDGTKEENFLLDADRLLLALRVDPSMNREDVAINMERYTHRFPELDLHLNYHVGHDGESAFILTDAHRISLMRPAMLLESVLAEQKCRRNMQLHPLLLRMHFTEPVHTNTYARFGEETEGNTEPLKIMHCTHKELILSSAYISKGLPSEKDYSFHCFIQIMAVLLRIRRVVRRSSNPIPTARWNIVDLNAKYKLATFAVDVPKCGDRLLRPLYYLHRFVDIIQEGGHCYHGIDEPYDIYNDIAALNAVRDFLMLKKKRSVDASLFDMLIDTLEGKMTPTHVASGVTEEEARVRAFEVRKMLISEYQTLISVRAHNLSQGMPAGSGRYELVPDAELLAREVPAHQISLAVALKRKDATAALGGEDCDLSDDAATKMAYIIGITNWHLYSVCVANKTLPPRFFYELFCDATSEDVVTQEDMDKRIFNRPWSNWKELKPYTAAYQEVFCGTPVGTADDQPFIHTTPASAVAAEEKEELQYVHYKFGFQIQRGHKFPVGPNGRRAPGEPIAALASLIQGLEARTTYTSEQTEHILTLENNRKLAAGGVKGGMLDSPPPSTPASPALSQSDDSSSVTSTDSRCTSNYSSDTDTADGSALLAFYENAIRDSYTEEGEGSPVATPVDETQLRRNHSHRKKQNPALRFEQNWASVDPALFIMEPALFDNKLPVYVRIRPRSPRSRDIVLDGVVFYESYFLACSNYADSGHREANNMERAQRIFNSKWISVYTDFLVGYKSDLEKLLNLKEPTNDPYQEFITVLLQKEEKATHGITDTSTLLRPRSHYVTRVVVNQMLNTTTTERIQVKETGTVVAEMKGEIDAEQVTLDELERSVHAKAKIQAAAVKRYNSRVVDRFTRPRRANIESVVLRRSLISDMMNDPDQNIDIIENPKSKEGTLRKRVKEVMKAKKHESMTEELRQASHKSAQARNELGVLLRRHERVTDAGLKPAPAFLAEIKEARTRVEETKLEYDNLLAATNKYTEDMEAKKRAKKKRPHKKQTPESRARMLAEQEEEEIEIANTQE